MENLFQMKHVVQILALALISAFPICAQTSVRLLELESGSGIKSFSFHGSDLVVGATGGKVYSKVAVANTWTVSNPFGAIPDWITPVEILENGRLLAHARGAEGGLKLSQNGGITWDSVEDVPVIISFLKTRGDNLFASTFDNVIHSSDGGETWGATEAVLFGYSAHMLKAINDSVIVASSEIGPDISGKLNYSWDGGITWLNADETYQRTGVILGAAPTSSGFFVFGLYAFEHISLPSKESVQVPRRFMFDDINFWGETWFANFEGFIHRSIDEGFTWFSTHVESSSVDQIFPSSDSTFYHVGSKFIDYVELPSALVTSVETQPDNQSDYLDLYPNPASREVTVESARNISCDSIRFLDILGRQVATVLTTPGTRLNCAFHTEHLPTGSYFVLAQSGQDVLHSSLIIIR